MHKLRIHLAPYYLIDEIEIVQQRAARWVKAGFKDVRRFELVLPYRSVAMRADYLVMFYKFLSRIQ